MESLGAIRFLSSLISRAQLAMSAGKSFEGKRDLYATCGYDPSLDPSKFRQRFERGEIAGRIVEAFPKATWRGGGEIVEDEDPEKITEFERAWIEFDARLHLWPTFERTDTLAGLGQYAILLIGAPGKVDTPLTKVRGSTDIVYLKPFSEEHVTFTDADTVQSTEDARYGRPNFYALNLGVGANRRVHYTRVLHVCEGALEHDLYGRPRLERAWNRLDDLDKVVGGGSESFWLKASRGIQFDIDPKLAVEPQDLEDLKKQVDEYQHGLLRALRTRGVDITDLGAGNFAVNFDKNVAALVGLICAGAEIPQRILMGSERGQLASEQDDRNWEQRVMDRRKGFADPFVVRPFVDHMIELGALPEPKEYTVRWPEAMELDDIEKVALAKEMAGVNKEAGITVITGNEIRDRALGWDTLPELENQITKEQVSSETEPESEPDERSARRARVLKLSPKVIKLRQLRAEIEKKYRPRRAS